MGLDYALIHLKYTIPPAIILTLLYRPLVQRIDVYKVLFLITLSVVSVTPWDSYLIRNQIWTYPNYAVLGPKLFLIPVEEFFFFFIQTYNTSLIYLIMNKPLFHPCFLGRSSVKTQILSRVIQFFMGILFMIATIMLRNAGEAKYLALILFWSLPFAILNWSISSQFFLKLPYSCSLVPIIVPTIYLWVVDTLALKKGTWKIESGTKLGITVWDGLEIEEAIFFLATNILIVSGLVTFDYSLAVLQTFPKVFPDLPTSPSITLLMKGVLMKSSEFDEERLAGIREAVQRLKNKSRSFYLASATFSGRLRIDLILLYSFCRVADDLIDNAKTEVEARRWISKLTKFLCLAYTENKQNTSQKHELQIYILENFPITCHSALQLLPIHYLSSKPLYDLLEGFTTDLEFLKAGRDLSLIGKGFPIVEETDLELYAARVAGTVAELCLELVFYHSSTKTTSAQRIQLLNAGKLMGIALQYVNIARDIKVDAKISRIYLPTVWLKQESMTHKLVLQQPFGPEIEKMRSRLLEMAFDIYDKSRQEISKLPVEARSPMRVAVESYMEIGRVLREKEYQVKNDRATIPKGRRFRVAWNALS